MKRTSIIILLTAFAAATVLGAAPQAIKVKATKKSAGSHQIDAAKGRKTIERSSKDVFYEFEISTVSPAIPEMVKAKWVVVTLNMLGNPRVGTEGEKEVALPKNKAVVIETEDFSLEGKDVHVNRARSGSNSSSEEKIIGYGLRIFDDNGTMLSETISSDTAAKVVTAAFNGEYGENHEATERKEKKQKKNK